MLGPEATATLHVFPPTVGPGGRLAIAEELAVEGAILQTSSAGHKVPQDSSYDGYSRENDLIIHDLDVLLVQSISNCGPGCARRDAMAKNLIAVGGLWHFDTESFEDDRWNPTDPFNEIPQASTGPARDLRIKPDLAGPIDQIFTSFPGDTTGQYDGTSGATPIIAGAVGLAAEIANQSLAIPDPSPALLKALVISTARSYGSTQANWNVPAVPQCQNSPAQPCDPDDTHTPPRHTRDVQGWGVPDLQNLYNATAGMYVVDENVSLSSGQNHSFDYQAPAGTHVVRATLVWTDLPATPNAAKALVNDLDLVVQGPDGVFYTGNFGLENDVTSNVAVPVLNGDRLNNVENVFVPVPCSGPSTWNITVSAFNVPGEALQDFALVVLGLPEGPQGKCIILETP